MPISDEKELNEKSNLQAINSKKVSNNYFEASSEEELFIKKPNNTTISSFSSTLDFLEDEPDSCFLSPGQSTQTKNYPSINSKETNSFSPKIEKSSNLCNTISSNEQITSLFGDSDENECFFLKKNTENSFAETQSISDFNVDDKHAKEFEDSSCFNYSQPLDLNTDTGSEFSSIPSESTTNISNSCEKSFENYSIPQDDSENPIFITEKKHSNNSLEHEQETNSVSYNQEGNIREKSSDYQAEPFPIQNKLKGLGIIPETPALHKHSIRKNQIDPRFKLHSNKVLVLTLNSRSIIYTQIPQRRYINGVLTDTTVNVFYFKKPILPDSKNLNFNDKRIENLLKFKWNKNIKLEQLEEVLFKNILNISVRKIFEEDFLVNFSKDFLNELVSLDNSENLLEKITEKIFQSLNDELKIQFLKAKLGLNSNVSNLNIPSCYISEIIKLNNQDFSYAFLRSRNDFILNFVVFYRLGLVSIKDFMKKFYGNIYYTFIINKIKKNEDISILLKKVENQSKWSLFNVIDYGISKILDANNPQLASNPSNISSSSTNDFSDSKAIEQIECNANNKDRILFENINMPDSQIHRPVIDELPIPKMNLDTPVSIGLPPLNNSKAEFITSKLIKNDNNAAQQLIPASPSEISLAANTISLSNEPSTSRQVSNLNSLPNIKKIFPISSNNSQSMNQPGSVKPPMLAPKAPNIENIASSDSIRPPVSPNLFQKPRCDNSPRIFTPPFPIKIPSNPALSSTKTIINQSNKEYISSDSNTLNSETKDITQLIKNTVGNQQDIKEEGSVTQKIEAISLTNESINANNQPSLKEANNEDDASIVSKSQSSPILEAPSASLYSNDKLSNSNSDFNEGLSAGGYNKKFSKSFADIFSLSIEKEKKPDMGVQDLVADDDDDDVKEPLMMREFKEESKSSLFSVFNIFKKKDKPNQSPHIENNPAFTRPLKSELKKPSKERVVINSLYANKKETNDFEIPGVKKKQK